MCQLTWKWKISYSDAYHRNDAFSWRERSSIFMINSSLSCYCRGSAEPGRCEIWLKTMMQFNATLAYKMFLYKHSGKTPSLCVFSKKGATRPPQKKHAFSSGMHRKKTSKQKCADTSALCRFTRWASSLCVCIHIKIHTVLPESRSVVVFSKGKKASDEALSPTAPKGIFCLLISS